MLARSCSRWLSRCCRQNTGLWIGRILGMLVIYWTRLYIIHHLDDKDDRKLEGTAHYFLSGAIAALPFRELSRLEWVPLSSTEEVAKCRKDERQRRHDA